ERGIQIALDVRQRDVHDRDVQQEHEGRDADGDEGPPLGHDPHGTTVGSWAVTSSVPESLWARLRAEPLRAPEHIALAAADRHAPAAAAWAAEKRSRLSVSHRELGRMAKRRHAALARFEGAATGVGGIFTAGPDLVLLAWI